MTLGVGLAVPRTPADRRSSCIIVRVNVADFDSLARTLALDRSDLASSHTIRPGTLVAPTQAASSEPNVSSGGLPPLELGRAAWTIAATLVCIASGFTALVLESRARRADRPDEQTPSAR